MHARSLAALAHDTRVEFSSIISDITALGAAVYAYGLEDFNSDLSGPTDRIHCRGYFCAMPSAT